jgi:hypothetical protein
MHRCNMRASRRARIRWAALVAVIGLAGLSYWLCFPPLDSLERRVVGTWSTVIRHDKVVWEFFASRRLRVTCQTEDGELIALRGRWYAKGERVVVTREEFPHQWNLGYRFERLVQSITSRDHRHADEFELRISPTDPNLMEDAVWHGRFWSTRLRRVEATRALKKEI